WKEREVQRPGIGSFSSEPQKLVLQTMLLTHEKDFFSLKFAGLLNFPENFQALRGRNIAVILYFGL
ncbi:MAG: hypothetical protein Q8940_20450, partial [Bacteroidota bacterium]|nr:hypothetical protein [Bacteroidota bacterium]